MPKLRPCEHYDDLGPCPNQVHVRDRDPGPPYLCRQHDPNVNKGGRPRNAEPSVLVQFWLPASVAKALDGAVQAALTKRSRYLRDLVKRELGL